MVKFIEQGLPLAHFVPCDEPEFELIHNDPSQFF